MRTSMGRVLALAGTAAILMAAGCQSRYDDVSSRELHGNWESIVDGDRTALVFSPFGLTEDVRGLADTYEAYELRDGELVMVQSGRFEIEQRRVTLINHYDLNVLVRTVSWDVDGMTAGTKVEDAINDFSGDSFELADVGGIGQLGRVFRAIDEL